MGVDVPPKGRLFALEGACGRILNGTAPNLLRALCREERDGRISYWDASGIFAQLRLDSPQIPGPSPRTLLLLFSADLAFRLRGEIQPALENGQCVIAAPYVHTAIAFGKAAGIPRRWMLQLFRFAPKPDACYRTPPEALMETCPGGSPDGYFEFCRIALRRNRLCFDSEELRRGFQAYLDALERRRRCETVTAQCLAASASGP